MVPNRPKIQGHGLSTPLLLYFSGKFGCRLKAKNEEGAEEVLDGMKEGHLKQEPGG